MAKQSTKTALLVGSLLLLTALAGIIVSAIVVAVQTAFL